MTRILAAVYFTILILTGNTMAQSFRERIPELAILKTLGFSDLRITLLVLAEAGAAPRHRRRARHARRRLPPARAQQLDGRPLPAALRERRDVARSPRSIAAALALAVGLPPALRAHRLKIVDALAGR